jgi:hypothetical protein
VSDCIIYILYYILAYIQYNRDVSLESAVYLHTRNQNNEHNLVNTNIFQHCVISDFRLVQMRSALFWDITQRRIVCSFSITNEHFPFSILKLTDHGSLTSEYRLYRRHRLVFRQINKFHKINNKDNFSQQSYVLV